MMLPVRTLLVLSTVLAALAAAGCGSSDSSTTKTTSPNATTIPDGRLSEADAPLEQCGAGFLFSTERDEVGILQQSGMTCAAAKTLAFDYLSTGKLPDGWRCNTWVHEDNRKNDASISCTERYPPYQHVGFTTRWL